jgi:hypothetical protein
LERDRGFGCDSRGSHRGGKDLSRELETGARTLAVTLFERFFVNSKYQKTRVAFEQHSDSVQHIVLAESEEFTDYLTFFEFVAILESNRQLRTKEVKDLFGYWLSCLNRTDEVKRYIANTERNGYEMLIIC